MRATANLWNACALAAVSLVAACAPPPVVTNSVEPACAQWESYTPTPWQLSQMVGAAYPTTINPDFANWRPLAVFLETNNRKRRDYCGPR